MAFCANCGNRLTEGARFCDNCGSPATGAPAPAQPAAAHAAQQGAANASIAMPGKPGGWLIPAGYVFAILGGLLGILIGGFMWRSKDKLPNGEKVSRYDASARRHGLIIFIIGIVMIILIKNMK